MRPSIFFLQTYVIYLYIPQEKLFAHAEQLLASLTKANFWLSAKWLSLTYKWIKKDDEKSNIHINS